MKAETNQDFKLAADKAKGLPQGTMQRLRADSDFWGLHGDDGKYYVLHDDGTFFKNPDIMVSGMSGRVVEV